MAKGEKFGALNVFAQGIGAANLENLNEKKTPDTNKNTDQKEHKEKETSEPVVSMLKSEHEQLLSDVAKNAGNKNDLDSKKKAVPVKKALSIDNTMIKVNSEHYLDVFLKCKKKKVNNIQLNSFLYEFMNECPSFLNEVIKGCQQGSTEEIIKMFNTAKKGINEDSTNQ